jgi:hypothetical protein
MHEKLVPIYFFQGYRYTYLLPVMISKTHFADRIKTRYTRKFGKLRSLENPQKRRMYSYAPSFEHASEFIGRRYAIQVLRVGKKKTSAN